MKSYRASAIPGNPVVHREHQKIGESLSTVHDLDVLHEAPEILKVGMVRYADGTDWNPGSGEGPYIYESTGWRKM